MHNIAINAERIRTTPSATIFSATWRVIKILPVALVAIAALPLLGILMLCGTSLRHDSYDQT